MLLYDKKENSIDVYEFIANENDLYNYRKQEMKKISEDKIIYRAEVHESEKTKKYKHKMPLFIRHKDSFNGKVIPMAHANSSYYGHMLFSTIPTDEHKRFLLKNFYAGNYSKCKIARIMECEDNIKYFLLTWELYSSRQCSSCDAFMDDIIQVPETLYFIQLLEQEKFWFLEEKDISEQLDLYSLTYVDSINLDELEKIDKLNAAPGAFDKAINKANRDSVIIKKYNEYKKVK